jgi:hypothetical protein
MDDLDQISLDDILDCKKGKVSIIKKNKEKKPQKSDHIDISTFIDEILNKGKVKFDHKNQVSMFYIACKVLNIFIMDLTSQNIAVSKLMFDSYVTNIVPKVIKDFTGNLKKRCKKTMSPDSICMGRKLDNKQCTRKKHAGYDFCKSHLQKLSNGRIDENHSVKINIKSKRGRKRKVEFDPRQYDNEYITLWEDIIDGEKVLIDNHNNVYTFDLTAPRYLGKKKIDFNLDLAKTIDTSYVKQQPDTKITKDKNTNEQITTKKKVVIQKKTTNTTIDTFLE